MHFPVLWRLLICNFSEDMWLIYSGYKAFCDYSKIFLEGVLQKYRPPTAPDHWQPTQRQVLHQPTNNRQALHWLTDQRTPTHRQVLHRHWPLTHWQVLHRPTNHWQMTTDSPAGPLYWTTDHQLTKILTTDYQPFDYPKSI